MPVISVRVDKRTYEALVKLAEARGMSLYSFVKALLEAQVSSEVSGEVSSQVSYQVSSEVSYRELERKLSELTSKVSYLEEKIQELLTTTASKTVTSNTGNITTTSSGNVPSDVGRGTTPQATTTVKAKSGERKRVIVFTLEWAQQKGINIEEYMTRREREGYLCNEANRKVYCVWREDIEQLIVDLNSAGAKMGELEKVLSGERLETAKVAIEAGLMWYDNKEKRWRAPL
jgi:TolA-binding protein